MCIVVYLYNKSNGPIHMLETKVVSYYIVKYLELHSIEDLLFCVEQQGQRRLLHIKKLLLTKVMRSWF
jgi:hypothetical protein